MVKFKLIMLTVAEYLLNLLPLVTGWLETRIQTIKKEIKDNEKEKMMK